MAHACIVVERFALTNKKLQFPFYFDKKENWSMFFR